MPRNTVLYVCSNCAYENPKWMGQCPSCNEFGTLEKSESLPHELEKLHTVDVIELSSKVGKKFERYQTGIGEFDRVLGGGLVPGEVVLVSGDPGIGKSTLLLQVQHNLNKQKLNPIYISAEESVDQISLRASRILGKGADRLKLISAFEINSILAKVREIGTKLLIIDSIQTIYTQDSLGLPGSISQIKNVSSKLVSFAKSRGIAVIIVGHITKQGNIAGPKLLEHLVDAVVQLEGDEKRGFRILRSFKNRYGSTNEVGIFEMTDAGMKEVSDPSKYFLEEANESRVGICPAVILEGNRALIIEVQALIVNTPFSLPRRVTEGISKSKLELLTAIISKHGRIDLSNKDIYINIAGGFIVKDPALDLAVVLAVLSSLKEKPLPKQLVTFGEVSLTGKIRKVIRSEARDSEVKRLGYKSFDQLFPRVHDIRSLVRKF